MDQLWKEFHNWSYVSLHGSVAVAAIVRSCPRTDFMAWNLHELRSGCVTKGGSRHGDDQAQVPTEIEAQAVGDHLGGPGCPLREDPPHPPRVLAQEADRAADRQLAGGAQRHHLPHAHRLPVGATPPQVRPQEHRPRLVPALVCRRGHGADLGGPGRGVRRVGGSGLAVAERRRVAGQGPVWGGKR
jgi:hypothetical protein